ncbi:CRTAC1 family protein [Actinocorallia sp. A-T 12471]|uniref:CRTAC1 family protein n=1 Tax=Actinocorallia sp. A-T 12471 TaxID=3089813 RepID=UPI0029CFF670|nr:CRTAC1 family protein [Actinocorallia sp. A-T 12471]MDX6741605.1 CRTAC1 family protein [Actinocorallia sp. A-T 12471]
MSTEPSSRVRALLPGAVALAAIIVMFFVARLPQASGEEKSDLAKSYGFTELPIEMPAGYDAPAKTVRDVNPAYERIRSWISSVGAAIAVNDLAGTGRATALCIVDTRTDEVVVTYTPTASAADRFTPFVLDAAPLPMDGKMAPMGCVPGDYNRDGRLDLLVYYWGRTPVVFLAKADASKIEMASYQPTELVPGHSPDGRYHGPRWNTNAVTVGSFAGTGEPDIVVANYFPDSDVLDPTGLRNVTMNSSMSSAHNAGGSHVLRWLGGEAGDKPTISYVEDKKAIPFEAGSGWTLAASNADLTGDGKPELYLANDFGQDRLLHNVSTADEIRFNEVKSTRSPTTPKSFAVGHDSFKGMGVDFADLDNKGRFDILVSNITAAWGLEESNLIFMNTAADPAEADRLMRDGDAPFVQRAQEKGLAWTGWGWDYKTGDFSNTGHLDVVQADGFVKGKINRWPWLQELAMSNDHVYTDPKMWPHVEPGDDLSGSDELAFFAAEGDGTYTNVSDQLGLAVPVPTRGLATGDTRGTGALDLAVARQWGPPAFYANSAADLGQHLTLNLYRPVAGKGGGLQAPGTPAYGATAQIWTADGGTRLGQLDGGGGHSGKRSFQVRFGLGDATAPVKVCLQWADATGKQITQELTLAPGTHSLILSDTAAEEIR